MDKAVTDIDAIIHNVVQGTFERETIYTLCRSKNLPLNDFCNAIALTVAKRFDDSSMAYEDADSVMNTIFALMIHEATRQGDGFVLAEPAYSIYLAFDAGEYDHHDGQDPVERYTKPMVKKALSGT